MFEPLPSPHTATIAIHYDDETLVVAAHATVAAALLAAGHAACRRVPPCAAAAHAGDGPNLQAVLALRADLKA